MGARHLVAAASALAAACASDSEAGSMMPRSARHVRCEVIVAAPVREVWTTWTTVDGCKTFFAPDARIEAQTGGAFELYFDPTAPQGERGSEGCMLLAVEPLRSLAFTWNAPPAFPDVRRERTRVDLMLEPVDGGRTRVRLVHSGWGEGDEWDGAYAYFESAWPLVLARLERRFAVGPLDWTKPWRPEPAASR